EGGACGDTPASKGPFLGTFKEQVDAFETDCKTLRLPLSNTLFIIWFGANDLYTAERKAAEMAQVAEQVAHRQRERLERIVAEQNQRTLRRGSRSKYTCKFIFCDLCRPLTSVRYSVRLQRAETAVRTILGASYAPPTAPRWGSVPQGLAFQADHTLALALS